MLTIGNDNLPLLVSLSGWMAHAEASRTAFMPLAKTHHCLMPDYPGSGDEPFHPLGPSLRHYAEWILARVNQHHPRESFVVVGNSMGGMVAQHLALIVPERVSKMILFSTSACPMDPNYPLHPGIRQKMVGYRTATDLREFIAGVVPYQVSPQNVPTLRAFLQRIDPALYLNLAALDEREAAVRHHDLREELPALQIPTLVLHGDADQMLPFAQGKLLADLLPRSQFVALPGAGHMVLADAYAGWCKAVCEFLG